MGPYPELASQIPAIAYILPLMDGIDCYRAWLQSRDGSLEQSQHTHVVWASANSPSPHVV